MSRRTIVLVLALLSTLAFPVVPVQAAPSVEVRIDDFPAWVGPTDALRAVLKLSNRGDQPADRLRITVEVHQGVATRSALERSFGGRLGPIEVSDTVVIDGVVEPGATRSVTVEKPLSEFRFFQAAPEDRVYPVRYIARWGNGAARPVDVHMIFFTNPAPVPLKVGLIIPLHYPPPYDPKLHVTADDLTAQEGLGRILEAVQQNPTAAVTLAPSGFVLDTLSDLSDGYTTDEGKRIDRDQRVPTEAADQLARLREVARQPGISLVAGPYSSAHLVWLVKAGLADRAQEQVAQSRETITGVLGLDPLKDWLAPTLGAMDEPTLTVLRRAGVSKVIVAPTSLPRPPAPLTRSAPAVIPTRGGTVSALVTDVGLNRRLAPSPEITAIQSRQRFLAETASIMLERPSESRVVYAQAPESWSPAPKMIGGILEALATSPWMTGTTPVSESQPAGAAGPGLASTDAVIASSPTAPPAASFVTELIRARNAIEDFARLDPPGERLQALERKLAVAESLDSWVTTRSFNGVRFAQQVQKDVQKEFAKIRAPARQTITLTSKTGVIPLVLSTTTDYPVRIQLRLDSDKLRFPEGTRRDYVLEPPAKTVDVQAIAETSGTFPLRVVLQTSDGTREFASSTLLVRSTAYNVIAVAITAGAALFLVVWWLVGASRRRLGG
jgi:uncharacterized protein DUF6049